MNRRSVCLLAVTAALWCGTAVAEQTAGVAFVRGEVFGGIELTAGRYMAELFDLQSHRRFDGVDIAAAGTFTFTNVPYGDYVLRITDQSGELAHEQSVTVSSTGSYVLLRLPQREAERPGGPISVAELRHPLSKKAVRASVEAQRLSEAGEFERAAAELEKAVRLAPEWSVAHTNLGVQYARLKRYREARTEFARAMELGKPNALNLANLAFAQYMLGSYEEAQASAGKALRLDPGFASAHYVMGMLLAADPGKHADALEHLELAAKSIPGARLTLEQVRNSFRR